MARTTISPSKARLKSGLLNTCDSSAQDDGQHDDQRQQSTGRDDDAPQLADQEGALEGGQLAADGAEMRQLGDGRLGEDGLGRGRRDGWLAGRAPSLALRRLTRDVGAAGLLRPRTRIVAARRGGRYGG